MMTTDLNVFFLKSGILNISGRLMPENGKDFFDNVRFMVQNFKMNEVKSALITLELEYVCSCSAKSLFELLKFTIECIGDVCILWRFEDDDILDLGETYKELLPSANFVMEEVAA